MAKTRSLELFNPFYFEAATMDANVYTEDHAETSHRFELEIDAIRARDEGHTNFESWIEKEKQRLWLGYFSIKL